MTRVQIIALLGSLFFLGFIVESIRKRRLREEYSLLWLLFGAIFLLFSLWRGGAGDPGRLGRDPLRSGGSLPHPDHGPLRPPFSATVPAALR